MKFSRSDFLFTFLVLFFSGALLYLYIQDINSVSGESNAAELGTIIFRKRTATRKPADSMRWERLKNLSTIYEGDTVRTSDASEAAVNFEDGTSLDVFENSMLKINFAGPVQEFQYLGGAMSIGGPTGNVGANASVVRIGDSRIDVSADARVSFSQEGDNLSVDVSSGQARVTNAAGNVTMINTNEGLMLNTVSGESRVYQISFIPVAPLQNARLLDLSANGEAVRFSMKFNRTPETSTNLGLELSRSSTFSVIEQSLEKEIPAGFSGQTDFFATVEPGIWFWRIRGADGELSPVRRFSLSREQPVIPALPENNAEFSYRKKFPSLHFSWRASDLASAYIMEISDNPDFTGTVKRNRTSLTSLTIQTLAKGKWYWRVIPVYAHEIMGNKPENPVLNFTVTQRPEMKATEPVMPTNGLLYQIQEIAERGASFSWKPEPEAVSYTLSVSSKPDGSTKLGTFSVTKPYIQLAPGEVPFLAKSGTWYWSVNWTDQEGNVSPPSRIQQIVGVDGNIAMRLSYPPDGYRVADSLIENLRFAWKSNVAAKTLFQISKNTDFSDAVYEEYIRSDSLLGKAWPAGDYYWRLRSFNVDDSVFIETAPRLIHIASPLPATKLLVPVPGSSFIIAREENLSFRWEPVPLADYYRLQLFPATPDSGTESAEAAWESSQLTVTNCIVPVNSIPDGKYRAVIQAYTLDSNTSSRIIGFRSDDTFMYKRISPVLLVAPVTNATIDGLTARRSGLDFIWETRDTPDTLSFELVRNGSRYPVQFTYTAGESRYHLDQLPEGTYEWTIRAALAGFDLSEKKPRSFTVTKIPLLPATRPVSPKNGETFGVEQLSATAPIRFSWTPVPGANRYSLRIYKNGESNPVFRKNGIEIAEYSLTDFSVLDKGVFTWEVEAQSYWTDGKLEQNGQKATSDFSIELPALKPPVTKTDGVFYGN